MARYAPGGINVKARSSIMEKVREAVRHPYAWPGGYPIYVYLEDGSALCPDCVRDNYRAISYATRHRLKDSWQALGADVFYEGTDQCAHCSTELESAYGDPETEVST